MPTALGSPGEVAARSDIVFISVVDAEQARAALEGADGILRAARRGLVVLVTATVPVRAIRDLAGSCASRGVALLDCGVNLGSRAADNGLLLFVGGPDDVLRRVRPVLDDVAQQVMHCGPLGAGMATKLGCQVVTAGRWQRRRTKPWSWRRPRASTRRRWWRRSRPPIPMAARCCGYSG